MNSKLVSQCTELFAQLADMPLHQKVETINALRLALAEYSPFKTEPVDCVQWVPNTMVQANDYNPNTVAPPEMKLLELSIQEDGYTQPIVSWSRDNVYEVIDGFHRHRVGKESKPIQKRVNGYLPLVIINKERSEKSDRMASTIRHNRARGKHGVDSMSDIVVELKKRNRSDEWIAKHLGMDQDEVLRLCQVSGLVEMFSDTQFSKSTNPIYEQMHKAGLSPAQMRICQPYGDDQRRGLWLYHILEPKTWYKVVSRVNGVNSGALYIQETGNVTGYSKITKPDNHTWKSFCNLLLSSLPKTTQTHYITKFKTFIKWWKARGYSEGIPDEAPASLEAKRIAPSYRRLCKVLLRNDYWCKGLAFTQPKSAAYGRYLELRNNKTLLKAPKFVEEE